MKSATKFSDIARIRKTTRKVERMRDAERRQKLTNGQTWCAQRNRVIDANNLAS